MTVWVLFESGNICGVLDNKIAAVCFVAEKYHKNEDETSRSFEVFDTYIPR